MSSPVDSGFPTLCMQILGVGSGFGENLDVHELGDQPCNLWLLSSSNGSGCSMLPCADYGKFEMLAHQSHISLTKKMWVFSLLASVKIPSLILPGDVVWEVFVVTRVSLL